MLLGIKKLIMLLVPDIGINYHKKINKIWNICARDPNYLPPFLFPPPINVDATDFKIQGKFYQNIGGCLSIFT